MLGYVMRHPLHIYFAVSGWKLESLSNVTVIVCNMEKVYMIRSLVTVKVTMSVLVWVL